MTDIARRMAEQVEELAKERIQLNARIAELETALRKVRDEATSLASAQQISHRALEPSS